MQQGTLAKSIPGRKLGEEAAWRLLQALASSASRGAPVLHGATVALDDDAGVARVPRDSASIEVREDLPHGHQPLCAIDDAARALLDLYAPLCTGARGAALVLAHLGQSLDGRLATVTGSSQFVTGPEDVRHTHRLRALFDAVIVGAQTASVDDPRLTTRLVPGRHPTRVVLDPHARLAPDLQLLRDGAAPTIVITAEGATPERARWGAHVELVKVPAHDGVLDPRGVREALAAHGLRRLFIEGGGVTVSRFLQAGLLDRLHVTVAPKIIGSGTPALQLLPIERIADAITAVRCRHFALGCDVLFDCDLRADGA